MHKYDEQFIEKAFELIPEVNFIAVDRDNTCFGYIDKPILSDSLYYVLLSGCAAFKLGKVIPTCDWKDSLRERKWVPKKGDYYHTIVFHVPGTITELLIWDGSIFDHHRLNNNLVYRTSKEAISACEKMLAAVRK